MTPLHDRDGWIWMDGEWVPWREARVHVFSHTLHYGMGCFEGVRAYAGPKGAHLFRVDAHTRRLLESAHALDIPLSFDADTLIRAQRECLARNGLADAYLKPTVFLGAEGLGLRASGLSTHVMIAAWDLGAYLTTEAASVGLRALTSSWARHHVNISLCRAKTCGHYVNSMLALNTAVKAGYDETIMLDPESYVAEASAANVFMLRDGVLHTPEVTSCLRGITRDSVIRLAREALGLLTGTAAEILPLRELDGRHIGALGGAPAVAAPIADDSVTAGLQRLYGQAVRGELAGFGDWLTPI